MSDWIDRVRYEHKTNLHNLPERKLIEPGVRPKLGKKEGSVEYISVIAKN